MCDNFIINWGDIPTWLSAVGTVGALFVALKLLNEDLKDRREIRKKALENDARKVSCWYEQSKKYATVWVQNMSEEPVYNLVANIGSADADLNAFPDLDNKHMGIVFGILGPSQKQDYKVEDERYFSGSHFPDIAQIAVEFTDSKDSHWRRCENGELKQIKHRKPFD